MKNTLLGATAVACLLFGGQAMAGSCPLTNGGPIKHVVYLQFDNTHFRRDIPNVASDIEQMPALSSFLRQNGVLGSTSHTQLISHTANGILNSLTGLYPDRVGSAIANSFGFYDTKGTLGFASDFVYWTVTASAAANDAGDNAPVLVTTGGKNTPAPWVPFTRAGCDFGAVALADMELENTTSDIANVFGPTSPQAAESKANFAQGVADFDGIALHCAKGSTVCAQQAANARPDLLPDEPRGYTGFDALFGSKYVVPAITNGTKTSLNDLEGAPIAYTDVYKGTTTTAPGFPGFDGMFPKVTLSYVAQMLEAGVPVVYGYLSDAHDDHDPANPHAYGPGEAGFEAQLADYDKGWQLFFKRLAADHIDKSNTLFVITVEEGDHFVGSAPAAPCNGVGTPCTYNQIGEIDADQRRLVFTQKNNSTEFDSHYDMAPAIYVYGQPTAESSIVRQLEADLGGVTVPNPVVGGTNKLFNRFADQREMKLLHMITADPLRTPSFVPFAEENYYVTSYTATATPPACTEPDLSDCVYEAPKFAWNHGGYQNVIATTWLGMVGPGVKKLGIDDKTWTDHTDIRPTILALAGLKDDYFHDGRVISEQLSTSVLPVAIRQNIVEFQALGAAYKQLNAPFGSVGVDSLVYATPRVATSDAQIHQNYLVTMEKFTNERDALAAAIRDYIENAEFNNGPFQPHIADSYTVRAQALIDQMHRLVTR